MKRLLRVGIVGLGFGQNVHLPVFGTHPRCRVTALCARTPGKAARIAEQASVPNAFSDWRRMIRSSEVDAVALAVTPGLQAKIALAALRRGKHVFLEKPVALADGQAEALHREAQKRKLAHAVDFEFCMTPAWIQARRMIDGGRIGRLRHAVVNWNVESYANRLRRATWKNEPAAGGGVLYAFGSHLFFNVEWLFGKIKRLWVGTGRAKDLPAGGETHLSGVIELRSGGVVTAQISTQAFMGNGHRWECYGADGAMVLENRTGDYIRGFGLSYARRDQTKFRRVALREKGSRKASDGRIPAVYGVADRFVRRALGDKVSGYPTLAEGCRVQKLLTAARTSVRRGGWVSV
ncbi:MAG: Gfo/Idh/MocA family oxidoreductase [Candidatus Omnitrophica bacterium]|nr:Gfo/Idh/MocA family oxidoreductase [Candidatus Omnitrophota bacterium]